MLYGIPDSTLKQLHDFFFENPEIIRVIIYGSRAMGREHVGSDIDFAIITSRPEDLSAHIRQGLEDLPTPYLFDVLDYRYINHGPLREHIDRVGKVFFQR